MLNYIQDNENIKDNALAAMLKDAASTYVSKTKKGEEKSFSSIINNLNSKTQKTQTTFVDKVAKTNTSSINKKVFDKTPAQDTPKPAKTADSSQQSKNNISDNTDEVSKKPTKKEQLAKNNNAKDDTQNISKADNQTQKTPASTVSVNNNEIKQNNNTGITDNTAEVNTEDLQLNTQKLSDINDNSSVEPSPVFLKDDTQEAETVNTQIQSDDIIVTLGAALLPASENNQQINKDNLLDKISQELISSENSDNIIEQILQTPDEFNLTKDNSEDIKNAFDKIKEIKLNNQSADFSDTLNVQQEVKQVLVDLSNKLQNDTTVTDEAENNLFSFGEGEQTLAVADYSSDFKKPEIEIDNQPQVNENTKISENSSDIEPIKTENTVETAKENPEIGQKIAYDDEVKESTVVYEDEKPEVKPKEDLTEYDDEIDYEINNEPVLKDKVVSNDDKTAEAKSKTLVNGDEKIKISNEQPTEQPKEQDNQQLVDLIKQNAAEIDDETIALNTQNVQVNTQTKDETLSDEQITVQKSVENDTVVQTQNTDTSSNNQNYAQKDNAQQLSDNKIDKNEFNIKQTQTVQNEAPETDDILGDVEITDENIEKTKLYAKVEQNSDTKVEDTQTTEDNLEKIAFEQEKLDEMIISMSKQTIDTSALTVADEVAKIAINEDTSINSPINVVYDSTGDNILLKNMQTVRPQDGVFSQLQQKLENSNILSQLTDKFEQIKDTINQKFTMVLRPNDLGRLSIELTNGLKGLITNIVVQNEHVRNFIEKNINTLRTQLASAGVNVNQIQIKTAGTGESTTYFGNQNQNQKEGNEENFNQNQNNGQEQNNKKQFAGNNDLLASLANFDTSFADDFSSVLNKTISYELN